MSTKQFEAPLPPVGTHQQHSMAASKDLIPQDEAIQILDELYLALEEEGDGTSSNVRSTCSKDVSVSSSMTTSPPTERHKPPEAASSSPVLADQRSAWTMG